jgi:putative transposase
MSHAREVLPGRSYLITRRCTQRQFLMRPDAETNQAFIYCLAVAAERHEIDVLFTVAMSNHHHTGIFDRHGNYPAFLEYFHKLFAKCQNSLRGRWENFWSNEQTSVVRLVSAEDLLSKLVYSVCNPVEAGLVEHALSWPGVSSLRPVLEGKALTAKRPEHFFRQEGPMPEVATLRFARPQEFAELTESQWKTVLTERVKEREKRFRRERAQGGARVLGWRKVLEQRWTSRPKPSEPRRKLSPRVASKSKWRRIEALLENKRFLQAYRDARVAFQAGIRTVLFPRGTYWLKRVADVVCEGTPYAT